MVSPRAVLTLSWMPVYACVYVCVCVLACIATALDRAAWSLARVAVNTSMSGAGVQLGYAASNADPSSVTIVDCSAPGASQVVAQCAQVAPGKVAVVTAPSVYSDSFSRV